MTKRQVLVVDDSTTFQRLVTAAVNSIEGFVVVGQAADGVEALAFVTRNKVDLVVMDLEMPNMNGTACVMAMRQAGIKARVLIFSATRRSAADAAFEALSRGADDFVAKPSASGQAPQEAIREVLAHKLTRGWVIPAPAEPVASSAGMQREPVLSLADWSKFNAQAVVIAASTGGPVALEHLFSAFAQPFHCPTFIVQHIPAGFTASLAKRLSTLSGRSVCEATHEETPKNGSCYICPGDFHIRLERARTGQVRMLLDQAPARNFVRPAADYLFESAALTYGRKCLGVVMTGMGSDGRDGAAAIKKAGGAVVIQNARSCAVFGMPKAVHEAGTYDFIGDIDNLSHLLVAAAG